MSLMPHPPLILIAAIADNGVIGDDNRLIWRLKSDLKRFRALTTGKPVIMGRKTFLSIGKPLPGRISIVLTRDRNWQSEGVRVAHDLASAYRLAAAAMDEMGAESAAIIGGADVYAQALPDCDKMFLTQVHTSPGGDAVFPGFDASLFNETLRETHLADADHDHPFTFIDYLRKKPRLYPRNRL
jgi:dihydrofolate reductase